MMEADESELSTAADEFNYWRKSIDTAMGPDMKRKAEYFVDCYKDIEKSWRNLEAV